MKNHITIQLSSDTEIAVIGDVHEHDQQFFGLLDQIKPSSKRILVSVGDLIDKGFGYDSYAKISRKIHDLQKEGFAYIVRGNHEEKALKKARITNNWTQSLEWLIQQPLVISFIWPNQYKIIVLHGGITPSFKEEDFEKDSNENKIVYIREVDENGEFIPLIRKEKDGRSLLQPRSIGKVWHEYYDGRFGYIASGHHAQKDGKAKFYKFSCNLDSSVYSSGILSCQIFGHNGLGKFITIQGKAANPKLDIE